MPRSWEQVEDSGDWWITIPGIAHHLESPLFIGSYEHSLDDKGRVALPIRFREILSTNGDARLILTTNVDPIGQCLVAYPVAEWQGFHQRIAGLPQFDEAVIRLKRLHIASACECSVDKQGRILVPPLLRSYASLSLGGGVVFAGVGNSIEVWDRGAWEAERDRAKAALPEINEALARFGL